MSSCLVDGCTRPVKVRGYCNTHYEWLRVHQLIEIPACSVYERFFDKVEITESCWLWTGQLRSGYGRISVDGQETGAHRVAYEILVGPIPEGLQIDHLCRVPACVNPDHLEPVTQRENLLRGETVVAVNARKTYCPQGHPYDDENTYFNARKECALPGRRCRICNRVRCREAYLRRKAG